MSLKIKTKYSPNFDLKKRKNKDINFLIFHYTGMRNEKSAIKKLTSYKSKVSCHYFIKKWRNIKFSSRFVCSLACGYFSLGES